MADVWRSDEEDELYAISIASEPDVDDLNERYAGARSIRSERSDDDDDAGSILTTTSTSDGASLLRFHSFAFNLSNSAHTTSESSSREAQASKAIEAAQGSALTPLNRSRAPSLAPSSIWPHYNPERTPLLDAGPAPPDYAQATAWRSLLPTHRARAGSQSAPSILSFSADGKFNLRKLVKKRWKPFVLLNLIVYCLVITGIILAWWIGGTRFRTAFDAWRLGRYEDDLNYRLRGNLSDIFMFERLHVSTAQCRYNCHTDVEVYKWKTAPASFSLVEMLQPPAGSTIRKPRISGRVDIRHQADPAEPAIKAVISTAYAGWTDGYPIFEQQPDGLRVVGYNPPNLWWLNENTSVAMNTRRIGSDACMDISITILFSKRVENFRLYTEHLDVDFAQSWFSDLLFDQTFSGTLQSFPATDSTSIIAKRGDVAISNLVSRNVSIEMDSGSIAGVLCVQDELRLSSQSGNIEADIFVDEAASREDKFHRGTLTPANLTTRTVEGDQKLSIQPLLFEHQTMLSDMDVASPNSPINGNGEYSYLLTSEHLSESGAIYLEAGPWWEGVVEVSSAHGDVTLIGKSLETVTDPEEEAHTQSLAHRLRARQGRHPGRMIVKSQMGNVDVDLDGSDAS